MRIGVFGGTFDPIHNTHLTIAQAAMTQARLDKVIFMVAARPPHKNDVFMAEAEARFAMVEAAVRGHAGFEASRIELDRDGPSYTSETLDELMIEYPGAGLYLIIGTDALNDLPNWRNPDRILARTHILAAPRPDTAPPPDALKGHYTLLEVPECELSSTEIRRRVTAGDDLDGVLPDGVREVIARKGLYREPAAS